MTDAHKEEWTRLHAAKKDAIEAYRNKKYGMFIHWGLYSELAGIYQGQKIEEMGRSRIAEWAMHAFQIPRADYAEIAKTFTAEKFDAEAIVQLAVDSGMKYLVITSKHHDGFALFKSEASDFTTVDATPFGRDAIAELSKACEEAGVAFGLYYSHSLDWSEGGDGGFAEHFETANHTRDWRPNNDFDPSPVSWADYIQKKALPQVNEIMTRYPNLIEIWYDVPFVMSEDESFAFYKAVTDVQPDTLVSARVGNDFGDYAVPGDNVVPEELADHAFETAGTTNNSWGYKSYDHDFKDPAETLYWIVSIVSKGGNYLLNIGPRADGTVPEESAAILRRVGDWLKINGDAIYDTRPWKIAQEGPTKLSLSGTRARADEGFSAEFTAKDFWFTQSGNDVYAISLAPAVDGKFLITSLAGRDVKSVSLLGGAEVSWTSQADGLSIECADRPDDLGVVFRVTLA